MRALFKISTLIAALTLLNSCYPGNPASPEEFGSIQGIVKVYDERGFQVQDFAGVEVSAPGTDIVTYTESDGSWKIDKLPLGTYNFEFYKEGYDKGRIFGYNFKGGFDIDIGIRISLLQPPKTQVSSVSAYAHKTLNTATIKARMTSESSYLVFFNDTEKVNKEYGNYKLVKYEPKIPGGDDDLLIDLDELRPFFDSGDVVYVVIYPVNPSFTTYQDDDSGQVFYAGLGNPSEVISFIMP